MPSVLRALLLAVLLTLIPVGVGVAVAGDPTEGREAVAYTGTPLSEFDSTTAVVQRASFCELLPVAAVEAALGGEGAVSSYGNGDRTEVLPGGDVAHEYGCQLRAEEAGTEARAWVFAPPVTPAAAEQLVAGATAGCPALAGAAPFGQPSAATRCADNAVQTITHSGLFGDAWLACSLALPVAVPEAEAADRAGRWCVAVATAASIPLTD